MLRLLGFVFLVLICVTTAPWGLVVGAALCVTWLLVTPPFISIRGRAERSEKIIPVGNIGHRTLSAIPLLRAVYCANCDSITDSDHDVCCMCGSRSVLAVSRLWQHTVAHAPSGTANYKISFTANVREIPAIGLSEAISLMSSLAELGGDSEVFHIQVEPVEAPRELADSPKIELVKRPPRSSNRLPSARRKAS